MHARSSKFRRITSICRSLNTLSLKALVVFSPSRASDFYHLNISPRPSETWSEAIVGDLLSAGLVSNPASSPTPPLVTMNKKKLKGQSPRNPLRDLNAITVHSSNNGSDALSSISVEAPRDQCFGNPRETHLMK
ncbi:hypothetical protein ACFX1S_041172 [Malus domestica]